MKTTEEIRLKEALEQKVPWKKWGPYLSERQWGTVREDYSENGDAWNFFTHDHARSRAYRWGEDGLRYLRRKIVSLLRPGPMEREGPHHQRASLRPYGPSQGQCYVAMPFMDLRGKKVTLRDL